MNEPIDTRREAVKAMAQRRVSHSEDESIEWERPNWTADELRPEPPFTCARADIHRRPKPTSKGNTFPLLLLAATLVAGIIWRFL